MNSRTAGAASIVIILFTAAIFNIGFIRSENHVFAQQAPLNQNTVAALVKPAVLKLYNYAAISLSVQDVGINIQNLRSTISQLLNQGKLDSQDSRAVLDTILALISQNPDNYLFASRDVASLSTWVNATGSGFIVTPDGYIVTNAHVVRYQDASIDQAIRNNRNVFIATFSPQIQADVKGAYSIFTQSFPGIASIQPSQEEINELLIAFVRYYQNAPYNIIDVKPNVFAEMRISVPGIFEGGKLIHAEVIPSAIGKAGEKDVAIIKIEGRNLPTVPLGDETSLTSLDDIIAVGFPGSVSDAPQLLAQGVQPSITKGQFSGFQPTALGFDLIQTSTPISHGNSGGPAVDASGSVIGITTSTTRNAATGQEENAAFNFLIPVSIVKDFLNRINVHPTESQFTKIYRQALIDFQKHDYTKALNALEQLNRISPGNPDVQNLMSSAQSRISSEAEVNNNNGNSTLSSEAIAGTTNSTQSV
jgi:serine protease Do